MESPAGEGPAGQGQAATTVRLDGVTKRYGEFVAVEDLSFEVRPGIIYGMLGPNGAGKTSTLRMINDIFAPDAGRITLFDSLPPGREAATRIGYLPEERGLYPKMKVGEILQFFAELRGVPRKVAATRAGAWLERLGLASWRDRRVQDLSKGMQQKVQFAVALIHEPDLLILDEPWSGLDPINAEALREIVIEQRTLGRTIMFSTHLMEQAEKLCDHICIVARGKKVLEGKLDEIKREATGDRLIALAFTSEADIARAQDEVLGTGEGATVAAVRPRTGYLEVELAGGHAPGELLEALVGRGLGIRRFEMIEPTLHQIFVERVGQQDAAPRAAGGDS